MELHHFAHAAPQKELAALGGISLGLGHSLSLGAADDLLLLAPLTAHAFELGELLASDEGCGGGGGGDDDDDNLLPLLPPLSASMAADDAVYFDAFFAGEAASFDGSTTGSTCSDAELEFELELGPGTAATTDADADAGIYALAADQIERAAGLAPPTAKRRRKRTYDARKDEIDSLAATAARLGAKLDFLKHRAGVQDAQSVAHKLRENGALREALFAHQLRLAGVRSLLSADTSWRALSPVSTRIHLERDPAQRRRTLGALKYQKLHDARRFLERRAQLARPAARRSESTRFSLGAGGGDSSIVRMDVVPLPRAASVKHAFEALMFYFGHFEICSTEALGDVTVREESAAAAAATAGGNSKGKRSAAASANGGVAQHRFVRRPRQPGAPAVETNSVLFAEYAPSHRCPQTGETREEALVVTDFVDRDDLFPYCPRERVRKDVTSILHLRLRERPRRRVRARQGTAHAADAEGEREQVVVLTMWYQSTLRRAECAVPPECARAMAEDSDRLVAATLSSVRNSLLQTCG